ncbi:hypothetical protein C7C45_14610 [Micromonospora arborensis]|uniref:Restriction endonuclease type IV Mrr domain-containing protein n=1 Tax=Micromonospora arborensis TaxID=2116518 RepID=A0A318NP22_9ACTN|nr:hypothetical protein C7C45_14610 [Micromonospora arborensis]
MPFEAMSPYDFEALIAEVATMVDGHREARLYGRSGRADDGRDVIATDDGMTYFAYQCKRVAQFDGAALRRAVTAFEVRQPFVVTSFIVVVACIVDAKDIETDLIELRAARSGLDIQVRDGWDLSRSLREFPTVVETAFGPAIRRDFCNEEASSTAPSSGPMTATVAEGGISIQAGRDINGAMHFGQSSGR